MEVAQELIKAEPNIRWVPLINYIASVWWVMDGGQPQSTLA